MWSNGTNQEQEARAKQGRGDGQDTNSTDREPLGKNSYRTGNSDYQRPTLAFINQNSWKIPNKRDTCRDWNLLMVSAGDRMKYLNRCNPKVTKS